MNTIKIRTWRAEDLPKVVGLLNELAEVTGEPELFNLMRIQEIFFEMENSPDFYLNLVAVLDEKVIAFMSMIFYRTVYHEGGTALINELVVSHHQRGSGIGKLLIDRAKAEAVSRGLDELEVGTEQANRAAQAFYRKCKFDEEFVLMGMEFAKSRI